MLPWCARSVVYVVQEAALTERLRAYVECRLSGSWIEYVLINCPYCLSYWVAGGLVTAEMLFLIYFLQNPVMVVFLCGISYLFVTGRMIEMIKKEIQTEDKDAN